MKVILYSFLFIVGLNFLLNAMTLGISLAFQSLDRPDLLGHQRLWGTIAYGLSAFFTSRLYAKWKTDYVYIFTFIVTSVLTIVITCFVPLRSNQSKKSFDDQMSDEEHLNKMFDHQNEKKKRKGGEVIRLLKKRDVMIFLFTTFIWGMSFAVT